VSCWDQLPDSWHCGVSSRAIGVDWRSWLGYPACFRSGVSVIAQSGVLLVMFSSTGWAFQIVREGDIAGSSQSTDTILKLGLLWPEFASTPLTLRNVHSRIQSGQPSVWSLCKQGA
jgi:hypothetical protein